MEALLLLAAAADDDQQPDDSATAVDSSDAPAETLLDRYRLSQQSRALNSRSRGRENWEIAVNGVASRKGSNGSTGDNYSAEIGTAGGASRRRASFSRMMSTTKASSGSSGGSKEPEVLALRRAYTKTYMENRRLTG
eukprot:7915-Heterococcus_DN1.PRE.2